MIVLDPVNLPVMQAARERGVKDFIGGNCTVSLMLMAVGGLMRAGLVEWITAMTYQSASGAGRAEPCAKCSIRWDSFTGRAAASLRQSCGKHSRRGSRGERGIPRQPVSADAFRRAALAGSLIPWIDKDLGNGQSREEWKAGAEANKIMGTGAKPIPVEGICVSESAPCAATRKP